MTCESQYVDARSIGDDTNLMYSWIFLPYKFGVEQYLGSEEPLRAELYVYLQHWTHGKRIDPPV